MNITSDFDAVVIDVNAVLAAILRSEGDGVDAWLSANIVRSGNAVRNGPPPVDDVEFGLAPSGATSVARHSERFAHNGARQIQ